MNPPRSSGGGVGWQDLGPRAVLHFFIKCFFGAIEGREAGEKGEEAGVGKETSG